MIPDQAKLWKDLRLSRVELPPCAKLKNRPLVVDASSIHHHHHRVVNHHPAVDVVAALTVLLDDQARQHHHVDDVDAGRLSAVLEVSVVR